MKKERTLFMKRERKNRWRLAWRKSEKRNISEGYETFPILQQPNKIRWINSSRQDPGTKTQTKKKKKKEEILEEKKTITELHPNRTERNWQMRNNNSCKRNWGLSDWAWIRSCLLKIDLEIWEQTSKQQNDIEKLGYLEMPGFREVGDL